MAIYVIRKQFTQDVSVEEENKGLLNSWKNDQLRNIFSWIVVVGFVINFIPILWYPNRIIEIMKTFIHFLAY